MIRTGIGFDAHRFAPGRAFILGGVSIESAVGLEGHSDADVLCHAVMDALLGAVAEGDLGCHFPDTDSRWENARSIELLRMTGDNIRKKNVHFSNVDATIIAEKPKLAPYVRRMRENIAEALNLSLDRISVKATTVERMGALGREEGVAALAIVTVDQRGSVDEGDSLE